MVRTLAELWRGLVEPSVAAIASAIALVVALFGLCARCITPELLASGAFVTFPGDDEAAVTAAALATRSAPLNRVDIALLGSSASREALETVHGVEIRAAARLGLDDREVSLHALTAGALTHVTAIALVDSLPEGFRGLVVLEISERNLALTQREATRPIESPYLPLDSALLDEALVRLGAQPRRHSGVLFLDHHRFFLARPDAIAMLWRGTVEPAFHQIENFPAPTPAEWENIVHEAAAWVPAYPERSPVNLGLYRWLIEHLLARPGVGVALLQAPRNPDVSARAYADPAAGAMWARYRRDVDTLAKESGALLWRIDEDKAIAGSMFKDGAHIEVSEARRVFTEEFARRVADWCSAHSCVGAARSGAPRLGAPAGNPSASPGLHSPGNPANAPSNATARGGAMEPPRFPPPVKR